MSHPIPHAPPELDAGRLARLVWRALRLHCPNCDGAGIFQRFGRLRPDCPTCGLQLDRGESDYFLGAYVVNLVAVELLFAVLLVGVVAWTWPTPPWDALQWGAAGLMVAGAIGCYPFAKTLWLAVDLAFRPVEPHELPGPLGEGLPR